ncbi:unnamed protein product [Caenorhabditis auriculariae]|uniref:BTB domain-containing protein n=1 Tax=Caenorhabditis auriculariae TaxID=2777116 RepID=A0A8S1HWE9_9PELO|nr:unnamed protein product [Caenorhabditis auriculariae]
MSTSSTVLTEHIVNLNVGGQRFATSSNTLSWIPDTFFTSLLSGRLPTVRDEAGAIFIDRDPEIFRVILNYLRTKQVDLSAVNAAQLKHEAQYFGLAPLVRRLTLCEELDVSSCGTVLFNALIPCPDLPFGCIPQDKRTNSPLSSDCNSSDSAYPTKKREVCLHGSGTSTPRYCGHAKKSSYELNRYLKNELSQLMRSSGTPSEDGNQMPVDPIKVRMVRTHHNTLAVAHAYYACMYRLKDSVGWQPVWNTPRLECAVKHIALNSKFGPQGTDRLLAVGLENETVLLWLVEEDGAVSKKGSFALGVPVDKLFFVGSQMVALSKIGKVGIWHSMTQNWQCQDIVSISCFDTAGSSLLLGCVNGSMYYIDMQKFPLRMKDNDLLVTELYRDPAGDCITAISVYLTPKNNGNWIEIAYGTQTGAVRVIVQHPETVGHGPQLFQTYTVHNSPVTKVALTTTHLISVCSEYNHVRSWMVTRFRGMISTQPGSMSLASFKVLTLDSTDERVDRDYTDPGPYGDQDTEQVFVQRLVPDTNQVFVRLASTGDRLCTIKCVDNSVISAFTVHECEGSSRIGSRPRRFLFCGTSTGNVQLWDLTTALDQYQSSRQPIGGAAQYQQVTSSSGDVMKPSLAQNIRLPASLLQGLSGPTAQELLALIDECDLCCSSLSPTPCSTPHPSASNLPSLGAR